MELRMKLNLGCGYDIRKGYVNIDIRPLDGIDKEMDVSSADMVYAYYEACDEILAYDILEHFPRNVAHQCLEMWCSLLKINGVLKIRCPDFRHLISLPQTDEWAELLLYGGQDYKHNFHLSGYTEATLRRMLDSINMKVTSVEHTPAGNIELEAVRCR